MTYICICFRKKVQKMNDKLKKILRKEIVFFKMMQHIFVAVFEGLYRLFSMIAFGEGVVYQLFQTKFPFTRGPLFYDHEITILCWAVNNVKTLSWLDRGYNNLNYVRYFEKPIILELGCGSGFYTKKFYALVPNAKVYACDIDKEALKKAKYKKQQNVNFIYADITNNMPDIDGITNVIWDACINFFTVEMQKKILSCIAKRLEESGGVLSGSGVLMNGQIMWKEYDHLFQNEREVRELLLKYFKYVRVYKGQKDDDENTVFFAATNSEKLKEVLG